MAWGLRYKDEGNENSYLMRCLICFLVLYISISLQAQQLPYSVGLHKGKIIQGSNVRYKDPMFGKAYILVDDSIRYDLSEVSYYQNEDGYFKRFSTDNYSTPSFYKREISGPRIEVYSKTLTYTSFSPGYGRMAGIGVPMANRTTLDYYIKDGLPPQRMSFKNLNSDLIDNPNSLLALQKVRRLRTVTGLLYAAGAGLVLTGFSEMSAKQSAEPNKRVGISPLFIAGVVSFTVPVFLHAPKRSKLIEAVEVYNK